MSDRSQTQCTVCRHSALRQIDEALVSGDSDRSVARRYGPHYAAVGRHRKNHLSPALQALHKKREEKRAGSLLDWVERLLLRCPLTGA